MSTLFFIYYLLSSANVTDVNLVLKERTHMRLCLNMLIFTHNLGNWLICKYLVLHCCFSQIWRYLVQKWGTLNWNLLLLFDFLLFLAFPTSLSHFVAIVHRYFFASLQCTILLRQPSWIRIMTVHFSVALWSRCWLEKSVSK